jgi:hypothetical protein
MNIAAHRRRIAYALIAASLAMLVAGAARAFKVYEQEAGDFGIQGFTRVSDRQMVIDATFGGVARKGNRLLSTYDRLKPQGKRACPT